MEIERVIEDGIEKARDGSYKEALGVFEEDLCFTQHPTAMSYYAVCLANVEGNYDKAISLCLMAAEKEFYNPEIYLNLGRLFLLNGQKSVAVRAFRKGLKYDNSNMCLLGEMKKLGVRKKPVLGFLPRQNMFNRYLGMLVGRMA
ncbi:MAG: tetratricopeptide repeat protein [Deltaproteobacteria bacterium]|nr:tetratricopeptide repeat protein [Deltaproteobacteria bacterium]